MTFTTETTVDMPETDGPQFVPYDVAVEAATESAVELSGAVDEAVREGRLDRLDVAADLLLEIDDVIDELKRARGVVEQNAVGLYGWKKNAFTGGGLKATRTQRRTTRWDMLRAVGRISKMIPINIGTGERDIDVDPKLAELVLRRGLEYLSSSSCKTTSLDAAGIEYDDLRTVEVTGTTVKVVRLAPATPAAEEAA